VDSKKLAALTEAGLSIQLLQELGPALTRAVQTLADIERNLLGNASIPPDMLEEQITMNRRMVHLLMKAAMAIQAALVDTDQGNEDAVSNLIILHPDRQAAHQAEGFVAFVEQCAMLVAAVESYADIQTKNYGDFRSDT
jgi:hypothetical protein